MSGGISDSDGVSRVCLGMGLRLMEVQGKISEAHVTSAQQPFTLFKLDAGEPWDTVLGLAFCLRWSVNRTD